MDHDTTFARLVILACHDLRTPLATTHGFTRTIMRTGDLAEPAGRYVEMIDAASGQLAAVLDELQLAARIESGRYEPTLLEVDSAGLTDVVRERLGERVRVEGRGERVRVDAAATARALADLAECAVRHGGLDEVSVRVEGATVTIAPITESAGRVLLGEELRDLGAAVAGRVIWALGGSIELQDGALLVRLPQ